MIHLFKIHITVLSVSQIMATLVFFRSRCITLLHLNISMLINHTALFSFSQGADRDNLFNSLEPLQLGIISVILMTFMFHSRVKLSEEIGHQKLLGAKKLKKSLFKYNLEHLRVSSSLNDLKVLFTGWGGGGQYRTHPHSNTKMIAGYRQGRISVATA